MNFLTLILTFMLIIFSVSKGLAEEVSLEQIQLFLKEGTQAYYNSEYHIALEKWEQGLNLSQQAKYQQAISIFLGNIGVVYDDLGQYQKTLKYYQQALDIHREIGNQRGKGSVLANLGVVYQNLGQYQTALDYYQQALEIKREMGDRREEGSILSNLGVVYRNLGQYQTALDYYQQALKIRRQLGDKRGESSILSNIGVVYRNLGQYQTTLDYYQQALEIRRQIDDRRKIGNNLSNIGVVYLNLGQYQKALDYYQKALEIQREIGDKRGIGNNLSNIGVVYLNLGQYQKALEYYQKALKIRQKIGDKRGESADLINFGVVYDNLGQYQKALEYYQKALAIDRKIGDKRGEAADMINIGVVYRNLGQYQKALEYYQQALAIDREIGNKRGEGTDIINIGAIYDNLGQYQKALGYYQKALDIQHEIDDKRGMSKSFNNIGVLYENLGDYQKAKQAFQYSLLIKEKIGADNIWTSQRGLAFAEAKLEQFDVAIQYYEQALDNIEKLRAELVNKEHKFSFMRDKLYVYDELVALLQFLHPQHPDKHYDRKALEIFERKQGRVFLEEMGQSGARLFVGLPLEVTQQEHLLAQNLVKTQADLVEERSKLFEQQNRSLLKILEQRQQTIIAQQQTLQAQIKQDYPDYYALKYPKPATLQELQTQVLDTHELMLVYEVMKNSTTLWVIGQKTFQMFQLPIGEMILEEKIAQLLQIIGIGEQKWNASLIIDNNTRGAIRKRKKDERQQHLFAQTSYALYTQLFPEEVRSLLKVPRMIYVVPTGPLYALPFEMLVTQSPCHSKDTHYLIIDVPIAYLSSASLLKILREAQQRRQQTAIYPLLAFANPVYDEPAIVENSNANPIWALRSQAYRTLRGQYFAPLPETAEEAKAIATLLDAPLESHPLQLGEAASRSTVLKLNEMKRLDDYQYVLFATHGILPGEVDHITQAALVLSHPDTQGYLTMADVFALQLNAKLVSLSACNTAGGNKVRGEGVRGLTRAFMYAGTPTIAVTLWAVESHSAKELSVGFFQHLHRESKTAQALRQIKLKMINGKVGESYYKYPYYWAPFVIYGDGQ